MSVYDTKHTVYFKDSRDMSDISDESINLIVTSPPYWDIKDYGHNDQIGYGSSLEVYFNDINKVFKECYRTMVPDAKCCINIGDKFERATKNSRNKLVPLGALMVTNIIKIGFDFVGTIIWYKFTSCNNTGGGAIMGSYPYPPNGVIKIDYEYIHVFRKQGKSRKIDKKIKEESKLTDEEWKEYFQSTWHVIGEKKYGHEAAYPREIPQRLIKMYSFTDDIVLDPFMGTGTTLIAAMSEARNSVGYELNEKYKPLMLDRIPIFNKNNVKFFKKEV